MFPADSRDSTLQVEGDGMSGLEEGAGHRQEKVRIYHKRVERPESIVRNGSSLKAELRGQMVPENDENKVSSWLREEQQIEPSEDIKPAVREYGSYSVAQRKEMFLSFSPVEEPALPPSKTEKETPPPEKTHPTYMSKREALTRENMAQERKPMEAEFVLSYAEQKEVTESFLSVHHEEAEGETLPPKIRLPEEGMLMKQADFVERSLPGGETFSTLLDQGLHQILPTSPTSCSLTVPPVPKAVRPEKLLMLTPKAAGEMFQEDTEVLERPPPLSLPLPAPVLSPEEVVCLEKAMLIKKTYKVIPKLEPGPKEDLPPAEVSVLRPSVLKDKLVLTENSQVPPQEKPEGALRPRKPASLAQKRGTTARTTRTKLHSTRDENKADEDSQEHHQMSLQRGIHI